MCTFVVTDSGNRTPPRDFWGGTNFSTKTRSSKGMRRLAAILTFKPCCGLFLGRSQYEDQSQLPYAAMYANIHDLLEPEVLCKTAVSRQCATRIDVP